MYKKLIYSISLALIISSVVKANITRFDVVPAFAPNFFSSPSWDGYFDNGIKALRGLAHDTDRSNDPEAYEIVPPGLVDPKEVVLTDQFTFPSWRGVADPASPFDMETGNRIHFGLAIESERGSNWEFSLDQVTWERLWQDLPGQTESTVVTNPTQTGDFVGMDYSLTRVGVQYGATPASDVLVTSGTASTLVNALYFIGVGDGIVEDAPGAPTNQEKIDDTIADFLAGPQQRLLVNYFLDSPNHMEDSGGQVDFLPEPSTIGLAMLALSVIMTWWRRH